jgi:hypothetical protein
LKALGIEILPPSGKDFIMPTGIRPPSPKPPATGESDASE